MDRLNFVCDDMDTFLLCLGRRFFKLLDVIKIGDGVFVPRGGFDEEEVDAGVVGDVRRLFAPP